MRQIFLSLLILVGCQAGLLGTEYPDRPIEMVIPFDSGSSSDQTGRLIAELAQEYLGQKVLVNNKPGGAGAIGLTYIKNSKPDGYVIGLATSTLASHKAFGNLPFDHHDVEVVFFFHADSCILVVPSNSPFKTLTDLIDHAKARPGELLWATSSRGGPLNIMSTDFFKQANIKVKIVPSGGGGAKPAIQASGGHVDAALVAFAEAKAQIEAGLLRPLALYANERFSRLPDIPTFKEYGFPVYMTGIRGIITPLGVAKEKLNVLHDAFKKASESKEFKEYCERTYSPPFYASFDKAVAILDKQQEICEEAAKE